MARRPSTLSLTPGFLEAQGFKVTLGFECKCRRLWVTCEICAQVNKLFPSLSLNSQLSVASALHLVIDSTARALSDTPGACDFKAQLIFRFLSLFPCFLS